MTDEPQNNHQDPPQSRLIERLRALSANADKGREPEFLAARQGRRQVSVRAMVERIIEQFIAEHGYGESEAIQAATTEAARLMLVKDSAEYIINIESIQISTSEKADLIRRVYAEMFTYGPIDHWASDPTITTISLEGANKAAVRHGHGDLENVPPLFEDEGHLRRIVRRLLEDAGAEFREDIPLIETGLTINGRRASITVALPPSTILLSVDMRLHPAEAVTWEKVIEREMMSPQAVDLLRAMARSPQGCMVVGEPESGKTTLLGLMARESTSNRLVAVERTGELHLLSESTRLVVRWPVREAEGDDFARRVEEALALSPDRLVLDEVRIDEGEAIMPLLERESVPSMMWSLRGTHDSKRLVSALGMLARRAAPGMGEVAVHRLYERLPFVVTLRRRNGKLILYSIAEWQYNDSEYPDFVELMAMDWEGVRLTGKRPSHALDLPENFWTA